MDEKSRKRVLRKLEQRGVTLEDLAQSADIYMCYAKNSSELEDPIGWYGWWPLEGIVSDERLTALEAGAEPTDGEMQSFRDAVVREKLSSEEGWDLPSAILCSLPEEFGTQVLVVFASRKGVADFDFGLFGLFENKERAIDALRKDFFLDRDLEQATLAATERPTR
jgi:hypothetical protein